MKLSQTIIDILLILCLGTFILGTGLAIGTMNYPNLYCYVYGFVLTLFFILIHF